MVTMAIAYLLGWAATSAYVGWLALQNARLAARQNDLRIMLEKHDHEDRFYSKAA